MWRELANLVLLFLPAGVANMAPVVLTRLLGPGRPVHERLFGSHKTWQGLIGGTAAGFAFFLGQRRLLTPDAPLVLGLAIAGGSLIGDLIKSYFKRRLSIEPGRAWFPFDQVDYIIGAIVFAWPFVQLTPLQIAAVIASYLLLHLLVAAIGYLLGLKQRPI
jgi:CDP-2,3-bis-(O-geranylgeranyl)-sn-glycerol synthase